MIDPAVFRAMVANGATPEMLLAVVEAAAAVEEEKREAKRSGNAERQRRFRERNASNALQGVTERDGVTETPTPSPSSSPDPSNNPTPAPVRDTPRARKAAPAGHRLPDDWQPEPLTGDIGAAVAKWPPGACDRELARFRDWAAGATGPNAKKSDWQATFRNWLRRADDDGKYRNEPLRSHRGPATRPGDGFGAALREMSGSSPPHH